MSRILPRYTDQAIEHDPLEALLARRETEREEAITAIANGTYDIRSPLNPRGWPIQTKGVSGTSPGTDPPTETIRRERLQHRAVRRTIHTTNRA